MTAGGATLRVLHLDTERGWRGGERQVLWLARELAERGHHSVVGARPGQPLSRAAGAAGLPLIGCAPLFPASPVAALRLRASIRHGRFDIVHAHTAHALTMGALATLQTRAVLVVTRRAVFPLGRGTVTRWKYSRARAVIAISRQVREVMIAGGVPPHSITVVPSGTDLTRAKQPASPDRLRALGVTPGLPLVLMVAALGNDKDPLTFVRSVADARDRGARFQALLAGDGHLMEAVLAERQRLGLEQTLRVPGWLEDADALVASCDVLVLSSRHEGLGSVLLDAMHNGKPVAATTAGGIPEVVADGETGLLVPPEDPVRLGAAIDRLCGDAGLRSRLGQAGARRVQEFSVARMTDATMDVYRQALRGADG